MSMLLFTYVLQWEAFAWTVLAGLSLSLIIATPLLLVEDPVLLFTKRKYDECLKSITRIAKINGKQDGIPAVEKIMA